MAEQASADNGAQDTELLPDAGVAGVPLRIVTQERAREYLGVYDDKPITDDATSAIHWLKTVAFDENSSVNRQWVDDFLRAALTENNSLEYYSGHIGGNKHGAARFRRLVEWCSRGGPGQLHEPCDECRLGLLTLWNASHPHGMELLINILGSPQNCKLHQGQLKKKKFHQRKLLSPLNSLVTDAEKLSVYNLELETVRPECKLQFVNGALQLMSAGAMERTEGTTAGASALAEDAKVRSWDDDMKDAKVQSWDDDMKDAKVRSWDDDMKDAKEQSWDGESAVDQMQDLDLEYDSSVSLFSLTDEGDPLDRLLLLPPNEGEQLDFVDDDTSQPQNGNATAQPQAIDELHQATSQAGVVSSGTAGSNSGVSLMEDPLTYPPPLINAPQPDDTSINYGVLMQLQTDVARLCEEVARLRTEVLDKLGNMGESSSTRSNSANSRRKRPCRGTDELEAAGANANGDEGAAPMELHTGHLGDAARGQSVWASARSCIQELANDIGNRAVWSHFLEKISRQKRLGKLGQNVLQSQEFTDWLNALGQTMRDGTPYHPLQTTIAESPAVQDYNEFVQDALNVAREAIEGHRQ